MFKKKKKKKKKKLTFIPSRCGCPTFADKLCQHLTSTFTDSMPISPLTGKEPGGTTEVYLQDGTHVSVVLNATTTAG